MLDFETQRKRRAAEVAKQREREKRDAEGSPNLDEGTEIPIELANEEINDSQKTDTEDIANLEINTEGDSYQEDVSEVLNEKNEGSTESIEDVLNNQEQHIDDPYTNSIKEISSASAEQVHNTNQNNKKVGKDSKTGTTKANIFIVISLVLLLGAGAFAYMLLNKEYFPFVQQIINVTQQGQPQEPEQPQEAEQPQEPAQPQEPEEAEYDPEEMIPYTNPNFEFQISHRAKSKLIEPGSFNTQLDTYQVLYSGPGQTEELTGPENLKDGYIFMLTVHKDVLNKDIDQITLEKRNQYFISCDSSAKISNITERTISNRTAKTFSVENCGVNYIESFFLRGNDLFEFNQIYRGDIGIRQVYKAETDEIVELFNILNTIQPTPQNTWAVYTSKYLSFKYPTALDNTCCTVKGPESGNADKIVVMADPKSIAGNDKSLFNGFAVYAQTLQPGQSIEDYIDKQRQLLLENYRVIIGKEPIVNEETINVDGKRGLFLRGYAWWGDLLFVETSKPTANTKTVQVFVLTEVDPGSFEPLFREILSTVKF